MKKLTITIALLMASQSVFAVNIYDEYYMIMSTVATTIPTMILGESSQGFGRHNDIIMVNDDAVIAMETGFVSDDLASVIEKLKTNDDQFAAASDEDVVAFIASLKQTSK